MTLSARMLQTFLFTLEIFPFPYMSTTFMKNNFENSAFFLSSEINRQDPKYIWDTAWLWIAFSGKTLLLYLANIYNSVSQVSTENFNIAWFYSCFFCLKRFVDLLHVQALMRDTENIERSFLNLFSKCCNSLLDLFQFLNSALFLLSACSLHFWMVLFLCLLFLLVAWGFSQFFKNIFLWRHSLINCMVVLEHVLDNNFLHMSRFNTFSKLSYLMEINCRLFLYHGN